MNAKKEPSPRSRKSKSKPQQTPLTKEVARLRRELAAVTRERDDCIYEYFKLMKRDTGDVDLAELRKHIGKGLSSDDLLAKLSAKKRT
jgi:hypothetical protein